jgi:uncharacterized membrane protein
MPYQEESIEVDVPVRVAYDQWTQFETFPQFMEGIERVEQLDDKRLRWRANVGGKTLEWDAEITDQTPDRRIAWRSTSGVENGGAVLFDSISSGRSRITVRIDYETDGAAQAIGSALGVLSGRIKGDLKRFKEFIESRGVETGAWRGEIHGQEVKH